MTTVDPVGRVLRWLAVVVGVVGLVVLVVGVTGEARRPPQPITGPVLAASLSDAVRSAPIGEPGCGRVLGHAGWQCSVIDHEGSGGASYDVVLRSDRCWSAALRQDFSEGRDMPRRASGCVRAY